MNRLPNLIHLRAFEAVARHLNISKAGDELYISHSAVSQQVKALEEMLGVSLLDRRRHKIKLTAAGQEYADTVINIFSKLQQATKKLHSHKNKRMIRLSIPNTMGIKCIIPKLNLFYAAYPDTTLELLIYHESTYQTDVDIEIACDEVRNLDPDLFLADDSLIAIKSPSYDKDLENNMNNSALRLIKVKALMRQNDWPQWLAAAHLETVGESYLKNSIVFPETMQAIEAVENALGIFVTHKIFVKEELKNKKLLLAHPLVLKTGKVFYLKCDDAMKKTEKFAEVKNWLIKHVFVK